jgi:hypothetical protein
MKKTIIFTFLFLSLSCGVFAQQRLNTYENIGWYGLFATTKINQHLSIHTEYQFRRDNVITDWQQSIWRFGLNYHLNPRVLFRAGYANIETFPYGEIPINGFGKDFTEHRIYQMAQLSHKEGKLEISHRFMFEQRFLGIYKSAQSITEDAFPLIYRMRYMSRFQLPLKGNEVKDHTPYLALFDEILIGFGDNIQANVFDQNRIGLLLGYRFNPTLRIEGGYINQVVQFGRLINGKNVFQHNNGIMVNAYFNLNFSSSK